MDIEERFVNIAYDTIKIEVLENFYNILFEAIESGLIGRNLELAINVKLKTLIEISEIEDDLKELLYSLIGIVLEDVNNGLAIVEQNILDFKSITADATNSIMEEIMLNQTSFCLKIKASYENSEMFPFDFLREFYKTFVRDMSLREGKVIIEDIDSDLILLALKKHGAKKQNDRNFPSNT